MAIRQVLLDGTGTNGDGTTWNDLSDATSAYIGVLGLHDALDDSAPGDTIFVKGNSATYASMITLDGALGAAFSRNPVKVLGVKSTTTANQGAISTSDLIPGKRTGAAGFAYDDSDIPTIDTSNRTLIYGGLYWYGIKIHTTSNIEINSAGLGIDTDSRVVMEECFLNTVSNDQVRLNWNDDTNYTELINTYINLPNTSSFLYAGRSGRLIIRGGKIEKDGAVFFAPGVNSQALSGHVECQGTEFLGTATDIVGMQWLTGVWRFHRCKFPSGYSLAYGSRGVASGRVINHGSDSDTSGITTSEQNYDEAQFHGDLAIETTAVRTGGADDGAEGPFAVAATPIDGYTVPGVHALEIDLEAQWVTGDGNPKTLTVFFASLSSNTITRLWNNGEVWLRIRLPSAAGGSKEDMVGSLFDLLGTPTPLPEDLVSVWGPGAVRPQKIDHSIEPDYEGHVLVSICFAPGNADTLIADPAFEVS